MVNVVRTSCLLLWGVHARAAATTSEFNLNGWYPCGFSTVQSDDEEHHEGGFECAQVVVPLCHPNVCESDKTIDVFVKRKVANATAENDLKQALWLLQGGPGASSEAMERDMDHYHHRLNGTLSVYTMDHRGTGRSYFLKCDAAQAFTAGSPGGYDLNYNEYPTCLQDILFQIDNQTSAFSVTSAAKDLEYLIETLNADEETYVYGASYGTYLTFREMHLAPKQIKGYIVDGIVSEAGPDEDTRMTYSYWDYDILPTTYRFFEYCRNDSKCPLEFDGNETALDQVRANLSNWDNECSRQVASEYRHLSSDPNSVLRYFFSETILDMKLRELIPSVLAIAFRCSDEDQRSLMMILDETLRDFLRPKEEGPLDVVQGESDILYNLIVFSEQWSVPSPTQETLDDLLDQSLFSAPGGSVNLLLYCLFTGRQDEEACKRMTRTLPKSPKFVYETDQYFNKTAPVPSGSSVLMFNGKLDYQTASEYGMYQYHQLQGEKMLVEFDYGGHCAGLGNTPDDEKNFNCGVEIGASYIRHHGDVSQVDTSCMTKLTPIDLSENRLIKMLQEIEDKQSSSSSENEDKDDEEDEKIATTAYRRRPREQHHSFKKKQPSSNQQEQHDDQYHHQHQPPQERIKKLHRTKRLISRFHPRQSAYQR